jgi:hypothetical protein
MRYSDLCVCFTAFVDVSLKSRRQSGGVEEYAAWNCGQSLIRDAMLGVHEMPTRDIEGDSGSRYLIEGIFQFATGD